MLNSGLTKKNDLISSGDDKVVENQNEVYLVHPSTPHIHELLVAKLGVSHRGAAVRHGVVEAVRRPPTRDVGTDRRGNDGVAGGEFPRTPASLWDTRGGVPWFGGRSWFFFHDMWGYHGNVEWDELMNIQTK